MTSDLTWKKPEYVLPKITANLQHLQTPPLENFLLKQFMMNKHSIRAAAATTTQLSANKQQQNNSIISGKKNSATGD